MEAKPLDAVDLDDWDSLAILPLERGIGRDIDEPEVASTNGSDDVDGRPAQMTAGSGVDEDAGHGSSAGAG